MRAHRLPRVLRAAAARPARGRQLCATVFPLASLFINRRCLLLLDEALRCERRLGAPVAWAPALYGLRKQGEHVQLHDGVKAALSHACTHTSALKAVRAWHGAAAAARPQPVVVAHARATWGMAAGTFWRVNDNVRAHPAQHLVHYRHQLPEGCAHASAAAAPVCHALLCGARSRLRRAPQRQRAQRQARGSPPLTASHATWACRSPVQASAAGGAPAAGRGRRRHRRRRCRCTARRGRGRPAGRERPARCVGKRRAAHRELSAREGGVRGRWPPRPASGGRRGGWRARGACCCLRAYASRRRGGGGRQRRSRGRRAARHTLECCAGAAAPRRGRVTLGGSRSRARIFYEHHWQHSLQAYAHALGLWMRTMLRTDACSAYEYLQAALVHAVRVSTHPAAMPGRPRATGTGFEDLGAEGELDPQ